MADWKAERKARAEAGEILADRKDFPYILLAYYTYDKPMTIEQIRDGVEKNLPEDFFMEPEIEGTQFLHLENLDVNGLLKILGPEDFEEEEDDAEEATPELPGETDAANEPADESNSLATEENSDFRNMIRFGFYDPEHPFSKVAQRELDTQFNIVITAVEKTLLELDPGIEVEFTYGGGIQPPRDPDIDPAAELIWFFDANQIKGRFSNLVGIGAQDWYIKHPLTDEEKAPHPLINRYIGTPALPESLEAYVKSLPQGEEK